jgi:hypothetical protein
MRVPDVVLAVVLACSAAASTAAQEAETASGEALRVFLDCQGGNCDFDYFRTEIVWVNWVRDRQVAQVHLLMTTQAAGGGREYTLRFIGLGDYRGRDDEIRTSVSTTATGDEERRTVVRAMKLGLVSYAARLGFQSRLNVTYEAPAAQAEGQAQQPHDPWNFWVFRIGANGFFTGESQNSFSSLNGNLRATRVTDTWKLRFTARGNRNTQKFTLSNGTRFETTNSSSGGDALVVRSLSGHWSAGLLADVSRSDRGNVDLSVRVAPGIEFNVFPYSASTRRQLTLLYELGLSNINYKDTTVFNKVEETLGDHRLQVSLVQREPWGSSNVSLTAGAFLHDAGKNRLTLSGGMRVRVTRGLDVNVSGSYSRIRDQLSLPKAGASDEDILLQLRQLQTGFRYFVSLGVSYTFGSIFNNIVNPRFSNRSGGEEFFFF